MATVKGQLAPSSKPAASRPAKAVQAVPEEPASNSLVRLLDILGLFTPAAAAWSSEELIRTLGVSRSSGYRYIKVLGDAGFLAPVSDGRYILGPRILQLDHQIRQCDPLYLAAAGVLEPLVAETGCSALVCALYSNSVLCIHQVLGPDSPPNIMGRGQSRPLFLGAASKSILAYLRPHQHKSMHTKHAKTIAAAGLGADWQAFRAALARIRNDGYVTSVGEVNPGIFGLSAPIFNSSGFILGSLGITSSATKVTRDDIPKFAKLVTAAAAQVSERIGVMNVGMDRTPRAVG